MSGLAGLAHRVEVDGGSGGGASDIGERVGMPSDESVWVERARQGDPVAFERIVLGYERKIYAFALRITGNAEDAHDVTQECFIRAYNGLPRITRELNVSAWLHRIASNLCLDMLRRRRRISWLTWEPHKHEPLLGVGTLDDPEGSALRHETQILVQQVLERMSPRNRMALVLREYEGMSCDEVAEVFGISLGAAKSTLFRAREEFRRCYREVAGAPLSGAAAGYEMPIRTPAPKTSPPPITT